MPNAIAHVVMLAWVPFVQFLFILLPARQAVLAAFVGAWLFLPMARYPLVGLPDFTKTLATTLGVGLGVLLFDASRLTRLRFHTLDLPILVFCLSPFVTSSINPGLGPYDGLSAVVDQIVTWGLPYLFGRIYFSDPAGLRALALAIVAGGLIYVPLALFEIRMSPQLHQWLYGWHQHDWSQVKRFGGFRPTVFMAHGLMVATWFAAATLLAWWLWTTRAARHALTIPLALAWPALALTTALCKSVNAWVSCLLGLTALVALRWTRTRLVLIALVAAAPAYMSLRAAGLWDGHHLVAAAEQFLSPDRVDSLRFRLDNESVLATHAMRRPGFGWGRWNRNRPDQADAGPTTTDGLWIIVLGQNGIVGLAALSAVCLLPPALLFTRCRPAALITPPVAPLTVLALLLVLYLLDCLMNAMVNPIYLLAAGGLGGFLATTTRPAPPARAHPTTPAPARLNTDRT